LARPEGKPVSEVLKNLKVDGYKGILICGDLRLTNSDLLFPGQAYQFCSSLDAPSAGTFFLVEFGVNLF
jgi:hypothetical protein